MSTRLIALSNAVLILSISNAALAVEPVSVMREAYEATARSLTSGTGEGTYRRLERPNGAPDWRVKSEANIHVEFDGPKYNVVISYSGKQHPVTKRIIVYDQTAIFAIRFSEKIHPLGAETDVFSGPKDSTGLAYNGLTDLAFDVSKLPAAMTNVPRLIERVGENKIKVSTLPNGDFSGEFETGKGKIAFERRREFGFHISRERGFANDGRMTHESIARWKKAGDVWYVSAYSNQSNSRELGASRSEIEYDRFEVNPVIPPAEFSLAALKMPPGSRILDHRPETPSDARVHYVPVDDGSIEARLDGMVAQMTALASSRHPPPENYSATLRLVIYVINALVLGAVGWYLVRRWRARHTVT